MFNLILRIVIIILDLKSKIVRIDQNMSQPKPFSIEDVSFAVKNAKFAVRGVIIDKALELKKNLEEGKKLGFPEIAFCNQGDPLNFSQSPLLANRQAISALLNPELLPTLEPAVKERVEWYLKKIGPTGNIGGYTESRGLAFVRCSVAQYI